ncbi:MAG: hypothetical protein P1V97_00195 [Planctomycetota bacterium]|nr:hypothetical protein [Planctomycetota bacterium]
MNGFSRFIAVAGLMVLASSASAEDLENPARRCEKSLSQLSLRLNSSVKLLTREYKAYLKVSEKTGHSARFDKELAKQSGLLFKGLRESIAVLSITEKHWPKTERQLVALDRQLASKSRELQRDRENDEKKLHESFAHLSSLSIQLKKGKGKGTSKIRLREAYKGAYQRWLLVKGCYKASKELAENHGLILQGLRDLRGLMPRIKRLIAAAKKSCDQESRYISESLTIHMDQLRLKKLDRGGKKPTAKKLSKKQDVKNLVYDAFCSVQKSLSPSLVKAELSFKCLARLLSYKRLLNDKCALVELKRDIASLHTSLSPVNSASKTLLSKSSR